MGCASVTEFITGLIRDNAPQILEQEATIRVSNERFDYFMAACERADNKPSARILEAAERLDKEGF